MALSSSGEIHCKVTHIENGNTWVRRVHELRVQHVNGQLYTFKGAKLPDAISIYSGVSKEGNLAEILLGTAPAPTLSSLVASFMNGTRARDLTFIFVGMFVATGLGAVADLLTRILNP